MLYATTAYGPYNDLSYVQADGNRSRWVDGAYQLAGVAITIVIAVIGGALIGGLMKIFNSEMKRDDYFTDEAYIKKDSTKELQQTKIVKVR